MAQIQSA